MQRFQSRCLCCTHVFSCPSLWQETFVRCDRQVSITRLSQSDHSPSPSHPWDSPSLRAGTHSGTAVGRPAGGEQHGGQHPSRHVSHLQSCRCFLNVVFHSDGDHFYFFGRFFFSPSRALLVARLVNYCSSNFQLKWKKIDKENSTQFIMWRWKNFFISSMFCRRMGSQQENTMKYWNVH